MLEVACGVYGTHGQHGSQSVRKMTEKLRPLCETPALPLRSASGTMVRVAHTVLASVPGSVRVPNVLNLDFEKTMKPWKA
jgi:hypothetical protein